MYRPGAFAIDDLAVLHDVIRNRVFATLALATDGAVRFAYAPVMIDPSVGELGAIRFHLAARNPVAEMADGRRVFVSLVATDSYVSPDWYRTIATVPTWNYIAVEGEGIATRLSREDLACLVNDLSAQEEANLLPKPPWTIDKVPPARVEALMNAIVGFSLPFETLAGKFKLSQDKNPDDADGVIAGLEQRGDPASLAVAAAMRKHRAP